MATRASARTTVDADTRRVRSGLLVLGASAATLIVLGSLAAPGPLAARLLSELRGTAAVAASGLMLALATLGFVALKGPRRRPVAVLFAAAVALGALTLLSQLSWLGEQL